MIQSDDLEPRRIELDRNLGTDLHQTPERILRDHYQNPITEDTDEIGKVSVEMPHVQSKIHSDYDSAESIADSDLEDRELRKMLASPLYVKTDRFRETRSRSNTEGRRQVHNVLKLITQEERA